MTRWVPTKREEKYGVGELRAPPALAPGLPQLPGARGGRGPASLLRPPRAARVGCRVAAAAGKGRPRPPRASPAPLPNLGLPVGGRCPPRAEAHAAPRPSRARRAGRDTRDAGQLVSLSGGVPSDTHPPGGHPGGPQPVDPILPTAGKFCWAGKNAGSLFSRRFLPFGWSCAQDPGLRVDTCKLQ